MSLVLSHALTARSARDSGRGRVSSCIEAQAAVWRKAVQHNNVTAPQVLITDPVFYAIAIPVVLLSGISKTGVPGLFGGMAVPLFSLVMPPAQAAALMLPVLCFIDLFGLRAFKGVYDRRNMPILLTGLAVGIVGGMLVFTLLSRDWTRVLVGAIAVAFALNNLVGWARHRPAADASWPRGLFWSGISGVTSFVAHAGGPPVMAYLLPQKLDRKIYVGTTVWFFFFANYAKIVPYAYLGQLDLANLANALVLLPLVPIGVWLGVIIQGKLKEQVFYRISYWAMLAVGVKLLHDGVVGLVA